MFQANDLRPGNLPRGLAAAAVRPHDAPVRPTSRRRSLAIRVLGCLFLAFAIVPVVDLIVLVALAGHIGLLTSVAIVIVTAALGAALVRRGGVSTMLRIQRDMAEGRLPTDALLDGACVLAAGAMMLTPGFITDGLALLLLLPPVRAVVRLLAKRWAAANVQVVGMPGGPGPMLDPFGGVGGIPPGAWPPGAFPPGAAPSGPVPPGRGDIIEGEVVSKGPARDPDEASDDAPAASSVPGALPERATGDQEGSEP